MKFHLKVPATSANLGPGFDTLGVALSLYLTVDGFFTPGEHERCLFEFEGEGKDELASDPEENLITRTALYVLRSLGKDGFGGELRLKVTNNIPLGRGLGSSGAAVVCGVLLANLVGGFRLPESRLLDFIIAVECHPDNVVPCLVGGLVASYVRNSEPEINPRSNGSPSHLIDVPNSEAAPNGRATVRVSSLPPRDAVRYVKLPVHRSIKAIAVIPAYHVPTSKARGGFAPILREGLALGEEPPPRIEIFGAMSDKLHQPYRSHLVPGLPYALETLSPTTHPGLLGICLSGAGPTVLAFATSNFQSIGDLIKSILDRHGGTDCRVMTLEIDTSGSEVSIET
ncbi:Trihydroxynaphthalene reductase [Massospora cicadina]|nr:Trihydroxynaphthalene reductase [Massospora cicadina]